MKRTLCFLLTLLIVLNAVAVTAFGAGTAQLIFGNEYHFSSSDETRYYDFSIADSGLININASVVKKEQQSSPGTVIVIGGLYSCSFNIYNVNDLENSIYTQAYSGTTILGGQKVAPAYLYSGTYRLEVVCHNADVTFTASYTSSGESFVESYAFNNNSVINVNEISFNQQVVGTLGIDDDVDYYRFTLNRKSNVELTFHDECGTVTPSIGTAPGSGFFKDISVAVLNRNQEVITANSVSSNVTDVFMVPVQEQTRVLKFELAAGTYYIKLSDWAYYGLKPGYSFSLAKTCTTHDFSEQITKAATCSVAGSKILTCKECGFVKTADIAATGKYLWDAGKVTQEASCTQKGVRTFSCSTCSATKTEEIPMLSHSFGADLKAATFNKEGYVSETCSSCGLISGKTAIRAIKQVDLSGTKYVYSGKVITPKLEVKDSAGKVISAKNYDVKYASGRKAVGKYAVKIVFKGLYKGSKTLYFTIVPKGTSLSKVASAKKALSVKWKKQATQTTGYQIQYATNAKFTGAKTLTVKGNAKTAATLKKLAAKKAYYVRIRTFKTVSKVNYYSSWSKAVKSKTK